MTSVAFELQFVQVAYLTQTIDAPRERKCHDHSCAAITRASWQGLLAYL